MVSVDREALERQIAQMREQFKRTDERVEKLRRDAAAVIAHATEVQKRLLRRR